MYGAPIMSSLSMEMERYVFHVEWYDKVASLMRTFYLHYFPADNTVELYDIKSKKVFLRKSKIEGLQARDFYVGGIVNILSRNMKITNYADNATKNMLQNVTQRTLAIIKPKAVEKMGEILKSAVAHNFTIRNLKMVQLDENQVSEIFKDRHENELSLLIKTMANAPIVAAELVGENVIPQWIEIIPTLQKMMLANDDATGDIILGSKNAQSAEKELNFFFPSCNSSKRKLKNTATFGKMESSCTCCIIKPHAVQMETAASIISDIQKSGFSITAMRQFTMDTTYASEFLEIYKGVVPDYQAMVAQLQSGPCIAMEICHGNPEIDVPVQFRQLCGPMDPVLAKKIRPNTLRAKYGKTKVKNAVHCSDLPQDGLLEVEYLFKILD